MRAACQRISHPLPIPWSTSPSRPRMHCWLLTTLSPPVGRETICFTASPTPVPSLGNRQGRNRLGSDGQLRSSHSPRALLLATGEEVPRGQSLRARLLVVEVQSGDVQRSSLNECQNAAQQGHFAAGMAAFISWVAGRYEHLQQLLDQRVRELRNQYPRPPHARLPTTLAQLQ